MDRQKWSSVQSAEMPRHISAPAEVGEASTTQDTEQSSPPHRHFKVAPPCWGAGAGANPQTCSEAPPLHLRTLTSAPTRNRRRSPTAPFKVSLPEQNNGCLGHRLHFNGWKRVFLRLQEPLLIRGKNQRRHVNDAAVKWRGDISHTPAHRMTRPYPALMCPCFNMFWCVPAPQHKRWTDFTFFFRSTTHSNSKVSPLEGDLLTSEKNGG